MSASVTYQGKYVDPVVKALISAGLSGENIAVIGPPGWGKTTFALYVGKAMVGSSGKCVFTPLEASSPPELITGAFDPAKFTASPPRFERDSTNTLFDPDAKIVILDELFRANDAVFDAAIHGLERKDIAKDLSPVVFATSNFAPNSTRSEACRDRFAYWLHIVEEVMKIRQFGSAQLSAIGNGATMHYGGSIPTWKDVENVRKMTVPAKSEKAILDMVALLEAEIVNSSGLKKSGKREEGTLNLRHYNPRRSNQWMRILFRTSAYYYGQAEFTSVHKEALNVLQWLWPATTLEEHLSWAAVCSTPIDPIKAAIDVLMEDSYKDLQETFDRGKGDPQMAAELGARLTKHLEELVKIGKDDPRVKSSQDVLTYAYYEISKGNRPTYDTESA